METIAKQIRRVPRAAGIRLSNEGLSFTHRPPGVLLSNFHRSGWTLDQRALSDAACRLLGDCRFTKPAQRHFVFQTVYLPKVEALLWASVRSAAAPPTNLKKKNTSCNSFLSVASARVRPSSALAKPKGKNESSLRENRWRVGSLSDDYRFHDSSRGYSEQLNTLHVINNLWVSLCAYYFDATRLFILAGAYRARF